MKKISFMAISALLVLSCNNAPQQPMGGGAKTYPVVTVTKQNTTGQLTYPTNIEGIVNSPVQAKVSGYITQVLVDEGQNVTKGQPLFRLETQALSQSAASANASVQAAQVEVDKLIPLVEKNIVSPVQLETAKANLARTKASYNEVVANLDYAVVRAPVNGVVGTIAYREGALVTANNTVLTTVSDVKDVYAYFSMNEKEYLNFLERTPGKTVKEKLANFPEVSLLLANGTTYSHKGKINASTGQIDAATGSMQFRATFPNPERLLTNGNSGSVIIPQVYDNSLIIPEMATFEQQGVVFTYKVENDTVKQAIVKLKSRANNLAVIESGLNEGDVVIVQGLNSLRSGMTVKPQPVKMDSIVNAIKPIM